MKKPSKIFAGILIFIALVLLLARFLQNWGISDIDPAVRELSNAKQIAFALIDYAENHDGRFPASLKTLSPTAISQPAKQFRDPKTGEKSDWIYYTGYGRDSPPKTIILASPRSMKIRREKPKRIAIFADGSGSLIDEDDFVKQLSEQLNRK